MRRRNTDLALFAALVVAIGAVVVIQLARSGGTPPPATGPSVVVIVTDDQRWDTLDDMPNVQRLLVHHGVLFRNGFVVNSLCCPSRASILTGEYSHSTGIYTEAPPYGGFERFDDSSTVATWLHDAGYRTALFGKYLNGYRGTAVPSGWDRWFAFQQNDAHGYYQDYQVNDDGAIRTFGDAPEDYSTDVLARQASSFIRETDGALFLTFAPYAPHIPATPAPRDARSPVKLPPFSPPNFDEKDVSDKPAWLRALPRIGDRASIDRFRRQQERSLQSVDDAVGTIVQTLRETGRLQHTLIAFVSDNGLAWGEHRWTRKEVPYEESIRIPFVVRYDAMADAPRTDGHLVLNIDLAPTIAAAAGVDAPGADGRSLLPLLSGRSVPWRHDFLIEHAQGRTLPDPPSYCAVRTERYLYVSYATDERELYDLRRDPFELTNRATDPAEKAVVKALQARLSDLCEPKPPASPPP